MNDILGALTVEQFLGEYWQKKPCLVRGALPGYSSPLDGDDLAGLACEEFAESRLVQGRFPDSDWTLRHGPFEETDFAGLPGQHWTLLVQDVEKHYPPLQELIRRFDFLPGWRLDDLMISYAAPGGSVGPHVDQYDVFLLQVQGRRLWQIATEFDPTPLDPCPLNVLNEFEPQQEWILKPGDMLYLPPGVAHHGVALSDCMTYSIGLRAPSAADLLLALGESLAAREDGGGRYTDPDLDCISPGLIDEQVMVRMRTLLAQAVHDEHQFADFIGGFLTRFGSKLEPANPDPDLDLGTLRRQLGEGARLIRNPWARMAWLSEGAHARLYACGESVVCSPQLAMQLCAEAEPEALSSALTDTDLTALLALLNQGQLLLEVA